jgi:hypothetical protein
MMANRDPFMPADSGVTVGNDSARHVANTVTTVASHHPRRVNQAMSISKVEQLSSIIV